MARRKGARRGEREPLAHFERLANDGVSIAFHHHIEELAYERLKDPEYQEWMRDWLERFFEIGLRKLREEKKKARR